MILSRPLQRCANKPSEPGELMSLFGAFGKWFGGFCE